jgi:hypothetical protein
MSPLTEALSRCLSRLVGAIGCVSPDTDECGEQRPCSADASAHAAPPSKESGTSEASALQGLIARSIAADAEAEVLQALVTLELRRSYTTPCSAEEPRVDLRQGRWACAVRCA